MENKETEAVKEQSTPREPQMGAWEDIVAEIRPPIQFVKDVTVDVEMDCDKPREYPSKFGGAYYVFDCLSNGEEVAIRTSAWSMLKGVKTHLPIRGKKLSITKLGMGKDTRYEVVAAK
jgi:hypothetical protein